MTDTCLICLESLIGTESFGTSQPCGHPFHVQCFEEWKNHSHRKSGACKCPTCNRPSTSFTRVFLNLESVCQETSQGAKKKRMTKRQAEIHRSALLDKGKKIDDLLSQLQKQKEKIMEMKMKISNSKRKRSRDEQVVEEVPKKKKMKYVPCDQCGEFETKRNRFYNCANCRVAVYCGKDCQRIAWPGHKSDCKRLAAIRRGDRVWLTIRAVYHWVLYESKRNLLYTLARGSIVAYYLVKNVCITY